MAPAKQAEETGVFKTETPIEKLNEIRTRAEAGKLTRTEAQKLGYFDLAYLVFGSKRLALLNHPLLKDRGVFSNDREHMADFTAAYLDMTTTEEGESGSENTAKSNVKTHGVWLVSSSIPDIVKATPGGLPPTPEDADRMAIEARLRAVEAKVGIKPATPAK